MNVKILCLLVSCAILGGCSTARERVVNINTNSKSVEDIGPNSDDFRSVCDHMARSFLKCPQIAKTHTAPVIYLGRVKNTTRFVINGDILIDHFRGEVEQLNKGKVSFMMKDQSELVPPTKQFKSVDATDKFKNIDYILNVRLDGMSSNTNIKSDLIHYSFQLFDAQTSIIVWEDFVDIKKEGRLDPAYR